jgi:hypothetical protein
MRALTYICLIAGIILFVGGFVCFYGGRFVQLILRLFNREESKAERVRWIGVSALLASLGLFYLATKLNPRRLDRSTPTSTVDPDIERQSPSREPAD